MHRESCNFIVLAVFIALGLKVNPTYANNISFEEINNQITLFKNDQQQGLIISGEKGSVVIDPLN